MKGSILITITLCLFGCSKDDPNPAGNTVHLAGYLSPSGSAVASYWKDSVYTGLTHVEPTSNVTSLYVDGSSVLIGGWKWVPPSRQVIWQDGIETVIDGAFGGPTLIASRNNNLFGVWHDLSIGWV